MLSYRIPNPAGRRNHLALVATPTDPDAFLSKQEILNRHLNKCFFKIGDQVTLKRPKRPRIKGRVAHVEHFAENSEWAGNQPKFITLEITKDSGVEKRNVGVKQLLLTYG